MRLLTHEPMSARPLSYLKVSLAMGGFFWYYDYWRRIALETIMQAEADRLYEQQIVALRHVRVGDEKNQPGLMEFLTEETLK